MTLIFKKFTPRLDVKKNTEQYSNFYFPVLELYMSIKDCLNLNSGNCNLIFWLSSPVY